MKTNINKIAFMGTYIVFWCLILFFGYMFFTMLSHNSCNNGVLDKTIVQNNMVIKKCIDNYGGVKEVWVEAENRFIEIDTDEKYHIEKQKHRGFYIDHHTVMLLYPLIFAVMLGLIAFITAYTPTIFSKK